MNNCHLKNDIDSLAKSEFLCTSSDKDGIEFLKYEGGKKNLIIILGLSFIKIEAQKKRRDKFVAPFLDKYSVYIPDRPQNLKEGTTISDLSKSVLSFADGLGLESYDVMGISQGGMIAQALATLASSSIDNLVLVVTTPKVLDNIDVVEKWYNSVEVGDYLGALTSMRDSSYSEKWLAKHKDKPLFLPDQKHLRSASQFKILCDACLGFDIRGDLEKIKARTLVVGGRLDKVVGVGGSQELREALSCDYKIYDDMGHGLYEEDKNFCKKAALWLDGNDAASSFASV